LIFIDTRGLFSSLSFILHLFLPVDDWIKVHVYSYSQPLMGLFFTLSGFVIMHVYDQRISGLAEYTDYLQKRIARMYPLHIATLALAIFLGLLPGQHYSVNSGKAILPNILLIHAWNTTDGLYFGIPSWSVSAEFFVYLLFPVFLLSVDLLGTWGALVLPIICVIANICFFKATGHDPWTSATYYFGMLRAMPSFVAGMAIYRIATVRFATLVVPGWLAHGLAIGTMAMMLFGLPNTVVLTSFGLVIFLLAKTEHQNSGLLSTPAFRALANCSYGFYLLHMFVGYFMLGSIPNAFHLGVMWKYSLFVFALVATTLVSVLSFHFFENPVRRYLSGLKMQRVKLLRSLQ
jgi:peptidoglycan/LPS O-acetylase OafA/YrhL